MNTLSNQSGTSFLTMRAMDAVAAIITTILTGVFIVAVVLPPVAPALVG